MFEALVIAAVLAFLGCAVLAWLAPGRARALAPAAADDPTLIRPALINLVLTRCAPTAAAYRATILDLAARGYLAASGPRRALRVELPGEPADGRQLTGYERRVLADMRARLQDAGGAPFEAVAQACTVDVHGTWRPFEEELRTAARRQGISRPLLPATASTVLHAGAASLPLALAALLAARLGRGGLGQPALTSVAAVILFWCGVGWMTRRDRLTAAGAGLAARCRRPRVAGVAAAPGGTGWDNLSPAALSRRALATATDRPGLLARGAAKRPTGKQRPTQVWSSFSGTWRLVRIESGERLGLAGGYALLGGAAWVGLAGYAVSVPGGAGPLSLILAAAAVAVAAAGVLRIVRMAGLPKTDAFDGQVIARWHEENDAESSAGPVPFVAVDDGQRAWTFTGSEVFSRVALGDLARITVNPRSRALVGLTITGRRRAETPAERPPDRLPARQPAGQLLTAAEIASVLGPIRRSTAIPGPGGRGGRGVIHKGRAGTLSLIVASGAVADLNLRLGRRGGQPLPGAGDEAWLVSRSRTVIVRVGAQVAKLTVTGRAHAPVPLATLAAAIGARLPAALGVPPQERR
jgi:hypothetical protein